MSVKAKGTQCEVKVRGTLGKAAWRRQKRNMPKKYPTHCIITQKNYITGLPSPSSTLLHP